MKSNPAEEAEEAIGHCRRSIERLQAEIERRRSVGHDITDAQRRLQTIQQILRAHEDERDRLTTER